MTPGGNKAPLVSDRELDAARLALLRQRLIVFGYVVGLLIFFLVGLRYLGFRLLGRSPRGPEITAMIGAVVGGILVMVAPWRRNRAARSTLRRLIRRTQIMVIAAVVSQVQGTQVLAEILNKALEPIGFKGHLGPAFPMYLFFGLVHLSASIVMPWTWKEALVPVAGIILATTALSAGSSDSPTMVMLGILLGVAVGLPGTLYSRFRAAGFRELLTLRLIGGRYQEVEHELSMARRIHERLFPAPVIAGPIHVTYQYEPMRQIGGDYLDLATAPDGSVTLALIDVTGHGVAAALAVHRLHGELKRIMAQRPTPGPAAIAKALNEYVFLTLADERVFATAALARIDAAGNATLCIAGHPSPLVVRRSGSVDVIDSTAMMLGAFSAADYTAEEANLELAPGESLLLYTDGVTEAANAAGRQLGTEGLRKAVKKLIDQPANSRPAYDKAIMAAVASYRLGAAEDDTLVVCATRV